MRKGNVYRLPLPPQVTGNMHQSGDDIKIVHAHLVQMTTILNQSLQSMQQRLDTVQQLGAKKPVTVTGLSVTGKQGAFILTWNRIKNADGYVITQGTDSTMKVLVGRYTVPDGDSCSFAVPVGNVAVSNSFQVTAFQGPQYGEPSPAVSATTVAYGAGESAPPTPPIAPRHPKIAPVRSGPNLP